MKNKTIEPYYTKPLFTYEIRNFFRSITNPYLTKKLEEFEKGKQINDFPSFLEKFRKKSSLETDLSDYSVKLSFGLNYIYDGRCNEICRDSYYQFILNHNDSFAAILGFEPHKDFILITQIQGVKGKKDILKPIKWTNALVNIALDWASQSNLSEVFILPQKRNKWEQVRKNGNGAKMYYDVTAKREGFKYDSDREVYVKKIESI
jgi:hypothetical protein